MKKPILNVKNVYELSKNEQKNVNGGGGRIKKCGGDGSYIIVNGKKVCCYIPWSGHYIC